MCNTLNKSTSCRSDQLQFPLQRKRFHGVETLFEHGAHINTNRNETNKQTKTPLTFPSPLPWKRCVLKSAWIELLTCPRQGCSRAPVRGVLCIYNRRGLLLLLAAWRRNPKTEHIPISLFLRLSKKISPLPCLFPSAHLQPSAFWRGGGTIDWGVCSTQDPDNMRLPIDMRNKWKCAEHADWSFLDHCHPHSRKMAFSRSLRTKGCFLAKSLMEWLSRKFIITLVLPRGDRYCQLNARKLKREQRSKKRWTTRGRKVSKGKGGRRQELGNWDEGWDTLEHTEMDRALTRRREKVFRPFVCSI